MPHCSEIMKLNKNKILAACVLAICTSLVLIPLRWPKYLYHLAEHQLTITFNRIPVTKAFKIYEGDEKKTSKLESIEKYRKYGKKIYGLTSSESYNNFVNLNRKELGWNITITPEFSFEPISFGFPVIGEFDYLGFFSREIMNQFIAAYPQDEYDIEVSEIGAYSTLGFFKDPIFSTYLEFSDFYLARLIFHEMAHEKLFFEGDTLFSEALATFIEMHAAKSYFSSENISMNFNTHKDVTSQYIIFWQMIQDTRRELQLIFESSLDAAEKRDLKKKKYKQLQENIKNNLSKLKFISAAHSLAKADEINNATLYQYRRYTRHASGFNMTFEQCNRDFECWFNELEKLKACSKEKRSVYLVKEIALQQVLQGCSSN